MRAPDFWGPAGGGPWPVLLAPFGCLYGAAVRRRLAGTEPWKAPVPVICVGNIVAGGAGKTPVALDLGARLAARGRAVHFLSRGHGGREPGPLRVDAERHHAEDVGDEPLLLARVAPTWVARDRAAGARAAVAAGAEVVIMDDGFQNPGLHKDLSLIVVDGGFGLGNGRLIPAGPLREPLAEAVARADGLVVLGDDDTAAAPLRAGWPQDRPVLRARPALDPEAIAALRGSSVLAFAGIGRPRKFADSLTAAGCTVVACQGFADHHPYRAAEIARLRRRAADLGARLATTEKDALRLPVDAAEAIAVVPMRLAWDDAAALDGLLDKVLGNG